MLAGASAAVLVAVLATPLAAGAAPQPTASVAAGSITYDVPPQPADHGRLAQGWGLFATISGRSMDIGARDFQWSDDPAVQPHDVEAGYGWRRGAATALIGYEEHDFGPKPDASMTPALKDTETHHIGGSGVLGLSLVLHAP
jgi:hypothetical protein